MTVKHKCPVCGSENGCEPTGGLLRHDQLNYDDWRRVYEFMHYVELPFLHNIVEQARQREKIKRKSQREMVIIYDDPPKGWTP